MSLSWRCSRDRIDPRLVLGRKGQIASESEAVDSKWNKCEWHQRRIPKTETCCQKAEENSEPAGSLSFVKQVIKEKQREKHSSNSGDLQRQDGKNQSHRHPREDPPPQGLRGSLPVTSQALEHNRPDQISNSRRAGSSRASFMATKPSTASRPSMMRWS